MIFENRHANPNSDMEPSATKPQLALPVTRAHHSIMRRALPPKPPEPYPDRQTSVLPFPRDAGILLLLLVGGALTLMTWTYLSSRHLVTVVVNDKEGKFWTLQSTVRGALTEAGVSWNSEDAITPSLDMPLPQNGKINVKLAAPVTIEADGNTLERRTQSPNVAGLLKENGIQLKASDRVWLDGHAVEPSVALPRYSAPSNQVAIPAATLLPMRVVIERALPISVNDNGLVSTIYTTDSTLGAALNHSGVLVYLGDYVTPDLGTRVSAGASVFIRRSRAATINVDGRIIRTRTRAENVSGLLAQEGVQLEGKDFSSPAPSSPVMDNVKVNITRVREVFVTETIPIAFETKWVPNPDLEIDERTEQQGALGAKNKLYKSLYENGKLVSRTLEREWIARQPQNHIFGYGTKIVWHDLTLPDGSTVQYWRKVRLLATSYTAATSGKLRDNPEYGITYLGLNAGRGIVAVDPRVVNLRSNVYVPGYGVGFAGDTGGRIKGRRIDLGYGEDSLDLWYRWVDAYLLAPVPPPSQINFILLDSPQEHPTKSSE